MIYLDNAATTGRKPQSVIQAVRGALQKYSANPGRGGHTPSMAASSAVYSVREKVAEFFGASGPESVVFTLNCTHSINAVIKGLLKKGDRVVTSSLEHNAVMRPLFKVGAEVDIAKVSLTDDNLTLSEFERKIRPETKLVICTGASNVLGKTLPIAKIGACCKARGVPFAVDAAQTAGVIPINMREMNIDYLCIAPHKGLYAPMGTGILICEKYIENTIIEGGTGTNSAELVQPDFLPERLESGTVNVPGIIGISAGIDYVNRLGMKNIYAHELELALRLWSALDKMPFVRLYTEKPVSGKFMPVLSFNVIGKTSGEVAEFLNKTGVAVRAGLHCAPTAHRQIGTIDTGTVRVSPAAFNTAYDIAETASAIKNVNFI
ncbi:MAG: aminotransferase class V-fold PLP-dependent enzyme [Acutalibacteraceae bacterium]|nr:aminotransferase class V-fold PLP-dependent enzyme [Acutalibacteraceae bacterium]